MLPAKQLQYARLIGNNEKIGQGANMLTLTLLFLIGLYVFLLFLALQVPKTPVVRLLAFGLLLAPVVYKGWDYPVLYFQHQLICKEQGGLKVLIQPEKVDRLRFEGELFVDNNAKSALLFFAPKLSSVEVQTRNAPNRGEYVSYSIDPQTLGGAKQDVKFIQTIAPAPNDDVYVISKKHLSDGTHRHKTEWLLSRKGKLYAKWTSFNYVWGLPLFGSPIGWQCFDATTSHQYPDEELIKLILKP